MPAECQAKCRKYSTGSCVWTLTVPESGKEKCNAASETSANKPSGKEVLYCKVINDLEDFGIFGESLPCEQGAGIHDDVIKSLMLTAQVSLPPALVK